MKKQLETIFSTRQYMLSKDFEIYYYNDKNLSSVGAHHHDYYEFYFFLEGEVEICIGEQKYVVLPGDFMLIPPGISHYPILKNSEKPYRRFVLWISQEYCNQLLQASKDYVYLMQYVRTTQHYLAHTESITFNAIQSMIFRLIEEIRGERFGRDAEIFLQVNTLILYLNRLIYEQNHQEKARRASELYLNICNYIRDHLSEDLSLEKLAGVFYVSKFHISHAFKDHIGISVHQYITKKRLYVCKEAILSGDPISKIYAEYGFCDYSSFFRAFKKEYGISPKEYREMYQL